MPRNERHNQPSKFLYILIFISLFFISCRETDINSDVSINQKTETQKEAGENSFQETTTLNEKLFRLGPNL